jgi:hypothetical protein
MTLTLSLHINLHSYHHKVTTHLAIKTLLCYLQGVTSEILSFNRYCSDTAGIPPFFTICYFPSIFHQVNPILCWFYFCLYTKYFQQFSMYQRTYVDGQKAYYSSTSHNTFDTKYFQQFSMYQRTYVKGQKAYYSSTAHNTFDDTSAPLFKGLKHTRRLVFTTFRSNWEGSSEPHRPHSLPLRQLTGLVSWPWPHPPVPDTTL